MNITQGLIENGIEVIAGINRNIDAVIKEFLEGNLKSGKEGCSGHEHEHDQGVGGCSCGHH